MIDIRTLYNLAIQFGYAKQSEYPFKEYKISKLKANSNKIAITKEEFELFKGFKVKEYPKYANTYRMFLFSYYSGGMNFKDMVLLKWSNVRDGRLTYTREKTKGDFNISLHPIAQEVLKFYENYPKAEAKDYVFPIILKDKLTEKQIYGRYKRCLRAFNK